MPAADTRGDAPPTPGQLKQLAREGGHELKRANPWEEIELSPGNEGHQPEPWPDEAQRWSPGMTPAQSAAVYRARGWVKLLPLPAGSKSIGEDWKPIAYSHPSPEVFAPDGNIALALVDGDIVDLDLDWPEIRPYIAYLFGTDCAFGRKDAEHSSAESPGHVLIEVASGRGQLPKALSLNTGGKKVEGEKCNVIECRSGENYTLLPGSTSVPLVKGKPELGCHANEFYPGCDNRPRRFESWHEVNLYVRLAAFAAFVERNHPKEQGNREHIARDLCATMAEFQIPRGIARGLVLMLCKRCGHEGWMGRTKSLERGYEKGVKGLKNLCELLGVNKRAQEQVREWLRSVSKEVREQESAAPRGANARDPNDKRPTLRTSEEFHETIGQAEAALINGGCQMYVWGTQMSRLHRSESADPDEYGVVRSAGLSYVSPANADWLALEIGKHTYFEVFEPRSKTWQHVSPVLDRAGRDIAKKYLALMPEQWKAPRLHAIIQTPTLRPDGSVLQTPGYDAQLGVFYDPMGAEFDPIPDNPTREDAREALRVLMAPFELFPWLTPADRSVYAAALLTAVVRSQLAHAPMFAFDASTPGSGKSKLVECQSMLLLGRYAAHMSLGTKEETAKQLPSVLMRGDSIISLDNCERPIDDQALCTMLSQSTYNARVLGQSKNVDLPTRVMVLASGNNLTIQGDMVRRALVCRLQPEGPNPEDREFPFDPLDRCRDERGKLVAAALTVHRAFYLAGRPRGDARTLGGFEQWSRWVRDALLWLGEADPLLKMDETRREDPRGHQDVALLRALRTRWQPGERFTARDVCESGTGMGQWQDIVEVLEELFPKGADAGALGYVLRKIRDRWRDGLRVVRSGRVGKAKTVAWTLEER